MRSGEHPQRRLDLHPGARAEQQLLDEAGQRRRPLGDDLHALAPLGVAELVPAVHQGAGEALHDGDRRAQLVRGGGEEQVLGPLLALDHGDVAEVHHPLAVAVDDAGGDLEPALARQRHLATGSRSRHRERHRPAEHLLRRQPGELGGGRVPAEHLALPSEHRGAVDPGVLDGALVRLVRPRLAQAPEAGQARGGLGGEQLQHEELGRGDKAAEVLPAHHQRALVGAGALAPGAGHQGDPQLAGRRGRGVVREVVERGDQGAPTLGEQARGDPGVHPLGLAGEPAGEVPGQVQGVLGGPLHPDDRGRVEQRAGALADALHQYPGVGLLAQAREHRGHRPDQPAPVRGPGAGGRVRDRRQRADPAQQPAVGGADGACPQPDLDQVAVAVAAPGDGVEVCLGVPQVLVDQPFAPGRRVAGQRRQRPADHVGGGVAEQPLRRGVPGQAGDAVGGGDHDRVGQQLQDRRRVEGHPQALEVARLGHGPILLPPWPARGIITDVRAAGAPPPAGW